MDTPYDGPIANSLNRMMEEEIPDSVNIIVLTGGTEEGWSWDLSLEGGDGSRDYSEFYNLDRIRDCISDMKGDEKS